MRIEGARFLVAGATGELGSALARALSGEGAQLALAGRNEEALESLGDELEARTAVFDAADPSSCMRAVDALGTELGGLDAAAVLPGVVAFGSATELAPGIVEQLFRVNVLGPIALIGAAIEHLGDGGALVATSAIVADHPTAGLAHYSAAKSALSGYLGALRHEQRRKGVNVIDVRPPHMATGFSQRPLAGSAPKLPDPIDPRELIDAIVGALRDDRREVAWDVGARALVTR